MNPRILAGTGNGGRGPGVRPSYPDRAGRVFVATVDLGLFQYSYPPQEGKLVGFGQGLILGYKAIYL